MNLTNEQPTFRYKIEVKEVWHYYVDATNYQEALQHIESDKAYLLHKEQRAILDKRIISAPDDELIMFDLIPDWCPNEDPNECKMYCYPDDGECACGVHKHHVHCNHGYVIQIG